MNVLSNYQLKFIRVFTLLLFINTPFIGFGQNILKGEIIDETSAESIAGATIFIKDSYLQTQSDQNGNFIIQGIKNKKITLYVSHISFETDTLVVNLPSEKLNIYLKPHTYLAPSITVSATRAASGSAIAFSNISKTDLEKSNLGQDLPYLIQLSPSVTVTSDAGNGIGYSGLRIRGIDPTRINVTINGIPVNDAESHQVYWVDLPDLASSVDNIQIQRGIGTSTNGSGAFGGSVNIQTLSLNKNPYASLNSSIGSFNTLKNTVGFGTGLLQNNFSFDGKMSMIQTDGFIDRANSDLRSFYFSGGYFGKKTSIKALIFSGKEKTYQAWYGVPEDSLKTNRTFNPAGLYFELNGIANYYDEQTDNYQQDNYQIHFTQVLNSNWNFNVALHGTIGKGYYEEYSVGDPFSKYGMKDVFMATDTISESDFIRQRWLDNNFYGTSVSANYEGRKNKLVIGASANIYNGDHYGNLIWSKDQVILNNSLNYYDDNAQKKEINTFIKLSTKVFKNLEVFADLQLRNINYDFEGRESSGNPLPQSESYSFFNPKIGLSYLMHKEQMLYVFIGIGQKEPVRDDFVNSSLNSRPREEKMTDFEAGYQIKTGKLNLGFNTYFMNYTDQLILNGKINDVGEYTRQNVTKSYRAGLEFELAYRISKNINLQGNLSLSQNKIDEFEEYIDDYDAGLQIQRRYSSVDIAFSPSVIASGILSWNPLKPISLDFTGKYVGEQFLDNTENQNRKLEEYFLNDFRFRYIIHLKHFKEIGININVNNLFDVKYNSNGYTYSYVYGGDLTTFNYFYPQAGRNLMAGINLLF